MHAPEDSHAKKDGHNLQRIGVRCMIRARLSQHIKAIVGAAACSYVLSEVVYVFFDNGTAIATAVRASCSLFIFTGSATYWSNTNPRVLRLLIHRPRYANISWHCYSIAKACMLQALHTLFLQRHLLGWFYGAQLRIGSCYVLGTSGTSLQCHARPQCDSLLAPRPA